MVRWSGQPWYTEGPYISAGASITTVEMTDADKAEARRQPIGFAASVPRPVPLPAAKVRA